MSQARIRHLSCPFSSLFNCFQVTDTHETKFEVSVRRDKTCICECHVVLDSLKSFLYWRGYSAITWVYLKVFALSFWSLIMRDKKMQNDHTKEDFLLSRHFDSFYHMCHLEMLSIVKGTGKCWMTSFPLPADWNVFQVTVCLTTAEIFYLNWNF